MRVSGSRSAALWKSKRAARHGRQTTLSSGEPSPQRAHQSPCWLRKTCPTRSLSARGGRLAALGTAAAREARGSSSEDRTGKTTREDGGVEAADAAPLPVEEEAPLVEAVLLRGRGVRLREELFRA